MSKVVGTFLATTREELFSQLNSANRQQSLDLIEIRLDSLDPKLCTPDLLDEIKKKSQKPLILTIRDRNEGGHHLFSPSGRRKLFAHAIDLGFEFIDLEISNSEIFDFKHGKDQFQLILSQHTTLPQNYGQLQESVENAGRLGADVIKLVYSIETPESALKLEKWQAKLFDSPYHGKITLFGMGKESLFSRLQGSLLGNHLTYVSLSKSTASADGQPSLVEFLDHLAILRSMQLGSHFKIQGFGSSHGYQIGGIISGIPQKSKIDINNIQQALRRRRPGNHPLSSPRQEPDDIIFTNGLENGESNSNLVRFIIQNIDTQSKDYSIFEKIPRPSHVDYPARMRYGDHIDLRGSGVFSGRMTAPYVVAGSIAQQFLTKKGIGIKAYISQIGSIQDENQYSWGELNSPQKHGWLETPNRTFAELMQGEIQQAEKTLDSVGGKIRTMIYGIPPGLGNPWFNSLKSRIGGAILGIPSIRGIEYGRGFDAAKMLGSEHNDPYILKNGQVSTKTNNSGGIVGGISLGTPISFQVAIKPTASIQKPQNTLNLENQQMEYLKIPGRHDPCIVPRVLPVIEAVTAIVMLNEIWGSGK